MINDRGWFGGGVLTLKLQAEEHCQGAFYTAGKSWKSMHDNASG